MKILKNKQKSGFKGTIIKIGLAVLVAFMVFGAFRSCVKVNAEVLQLEQNEMYGWTINKVNGQYPTYYIGNIFAEFDIVSNSFTAVYSCTNMFNYGGVSYNRIVVDQYVYNNGLSMEENIYYQVSAISDPFYIYRSNWTREAIGDNWSSNSESFVDGVSPYFVITNININLSVTGVTGSFNVSDTLYPYLTYVTNNTGYDLYQQGYIYGYNKALSEINYDQYWSNGYNTGYDNGYNDGLNDPHNPLLGQGFSDGYDFGYNDGYDDGLNYDNPYTFKTLFLSALEAPVTVIAGALNFDFLGYNLKDFVFSIFTIAIIAFIVKRLI